MNLVDLIKEDEGLRLKPYRCTAGKLTIGYGHNIEDNGIPEHIAEALLDYDLDVADEELRDNLPFYWQLSEVRKAVLVSMCINLGWPRLSGFEKMIAALEARAYETAAYEMLDSRWARQVGNRAKRLAWMMQHDKWPQGTEYLEGV